MNEDQDKENRRDFLALAASAAAIGMGAALSAPQAVAAHHEPATEMAGDIARWFDAVPGRHRQVTDWPELNNGMGLMYTLGFLMTAPVGLGVPPSEVGAVLVIRPDTIALALGDAVWAKYRLGEMFHIEDPETKAPAVRNPYYLEPGALPFAEAALARLIERGVGVVACELALTFRSAMIAKKLGFDPAAARKEWLDAVLPGVRVMPSGVFACHAAAKRGCTYLFAG